MVEKTIVNQTSKPDSCNRGGTFVWKYHSKLSSVIVTGAMVTHYYVKSVSTTHLDWVGTLCANKKNMH